MNDYQSKLEEDNMKVFIIFIGLLILNVTFITYHGDLNHYIQLQTFLKATAEECAAGASLYYDEDAYSRGMMVINQTEANKYVNDLVERASQILSLEDTEGLSYEMKIADDSSGDLEQGMPPNVVVTLRLTTADLFRLSFIKIEQVVRSAKYELVE